MIIQIKPYQLFAKKKSFLIVFCLGIVFFIVGLSCIAVYISEYYKRLEKQNNDASQKVTSIVFEKPTVDFIIVSGVFSVLFLIFNFVLFIMYKHIFRFQKSWVLLLLLMLFIMAFGLILLNIVYVATNPPCPSSYTLSDDGSSCTISNYKPPSSGGGTFNSLKFWNGNSYASWDVSEDQQNVSLNFTKENQAPLNGYLQVFNKGYIPDILQIFPLPTYNGTEKLYLAYQYDDNGKQINNMKYDWRDYCPPEDPTSFDYNICTYPRDNSFNQMTEISDSEKNQPSSFPDRISSIVFKNGIKMYIGKDNNFYILGETACIKVYLDIYTNPVDALCKDGLVNINIWSCDGQGGADTSYTQDDLRSGLMIADLSMADNPPTQNDTSIQYNNCSIGYITDKFDAYLDGSDSPPEYQYTINDTKKDTFVVSEPSDTYEPIQNFESVEFGSCQIYQKDDDSIELKLGLTFLTFYLNSAHDDIFVVGTITEANNLTYGTGNGWKTN